jgi:hypothetical protein
MTCHVSRTNHNQCRGGYLNVSPLAVHGTAPTLLETLRHIRFSDIPFREESMKYGSYDIIGSINLGNRLNAPVLRRIHKFGVLDAQLLTSIIAVVYIPK